MIRMLISWKSFVMLYLRLILLLSCNKVSEKNKTIEDTQLKQSDTQKRIIIPYSDPNIPLGGTHKITLLPKNDENWIIKFSQRSLMKAPGEKGYKRVREISPCKIIYTKYLNDSTICVKVNGALGHASYKGIIRTLKDEILLSYYIDTEKPVAMSILEYEFEYIIRVKKGKRYTISMFSEKQSL